MIYIYIYKWFLGWQEIVSVAEAATEEVLPVTLYYLYGLFDSSVY
jgi:hypothetical protein